jgi:hypothetical protein
MNIGTYYLPKSTMLYLLHSIADGNITENSISENHNSGFSGEVVRFLSNYFKVKPSNLEHKDIRVLS